MKKNHHRVAILDSTYSLLLYLCYSSKEEICNTIFIFSDGIHSSIRKNFRKSYHLTFYYKNNLVFYLKSICFIFLRYTKYKFVDNSDIYCLDHTDIAPHLIRKNKYVLIEDGPYTLKYEEERRVNQKRIISPFLKFRRFLISPIYYNGWGQNSQCKKIIVASNYSSYLFNNLKREICPFSDLWEGSDICKKKKILSFFNLTEETLKQIQNKKILVLGQTFVVDKVLNKEENSLLYDKILSQYDRNLILFKKHPREIDSLTNDFKEAYDIFDMPVPLQLLDLVGVHFDKVITICSSAVLSIPYPINIVWIGTAIDNRLVLKYGDLKLSDFQK